MIKSAAIFDIHISALHLVLTDLGTYVLFAITFSDILMLNADKPVKLELSTCPVF